MNKNYIIGVSLVISCCFLLLSCQGSSPVTTSVSKVSKDASPVVANVGDTVITENQ